MDEAARSYKIVLGVIGADCHAVGNRILTAVLTRGGIEVVNLGVMVSQEEFIEAAIAEDAGRSSCRRSTVMVNWIVRISAPAARNAVWATSSFMSAATW
ncbi:cobalamin-dependent protein [Gemmobacter lanyuensis]